MPVFFHEINRTKKLTMIWGGCIIFMLVVCIMIFPEMKSSMGDINEMFADMGDFTAAFGMDKISFGTLMGYYGTECGNVLGLGGGFFAAYIGVSALAKEEKEHTAEFLLSHPVSRNRIITSKLAAVAVQIVLINIAVVAASLLSTAVIGESMEIKEFFMLHLAYTIMQLEIGFICFGISAFISHSAIGIGIGIAALFYFLNIISNITSDAEFLKYITPFSYSDPAEVINNTSIEPKYLCCGIAFAVIGIVAAYIKYTKKDINA